MTDRVSIRCPNCHGLLAIKLADGRYEHRSSRPTRTAVRVMVGDVECVTCSVVVHVDTRSGDPTVLPDRAPDGRAEGAAMQGG